MMLVGKRVIQSSCRASEESSGSPKAALLSDL